MKRQVVIGSTILVIILFSFQCKSPVKDTSEIELKTRMDTVSYIIGLDYGIGVREEKIDASPIVVYKGFTDGLNDTSLLTDSIKNKIIDEFNEILDTRIKEDEKRILETNLADGKDFLVENLNNDGVILLPSGLQFKILKDGVGKKPQSTDSVLVHYRAMFIDRSVFDMSYDRGPAGIRINTVIQGLSEGLQLMKSGGIYELYIPPELAYGDKNFANVIPAGSTLIYAIELIEITK